MKTDDVIINSEQAVIGSILRDNDSFDLIDLKSNDFFIRSHQIIFAELVEMLGAGKSADLITLAESLDKKGLLQDAGDLKYIGEIAQNCLTSKNIKAHANAVKKYSKLRKIKALAAEMIDLADSKNDIETITELVESGMFGLIENNQSEKPRHIKDAVIEAIEFEEQSKFGLNTGLRDLDRLLGGFKKSDLIIVAGRPSMGKSALSMQIGELVSRREPVIIFSLEMADRQVGHRFFKYHKSKIGDSQALKHLSELKLHIDDTPGVTLQYIRSQCRKMKRQHGLSMIVIDYLQLMRGKGDNRNQEIGSISRGLKSIAKEFDIPVVALSQLSRKVDERSDKRPIMSDLRESGEIEQDADVILFIYRDEVYNPETNDKGVAEILCRKNRQGSIGTVYTSFMGALTRFDNFDGEVTKQSAQKPRGFIV